MQRLEASLSNVKTGDIVLFSGTQRQSALIKGVTRCKWSHVGMVVRLKAWRSPLLFESTSRGCVPDIECGKLINGVQLVPLVERIYTFAGDVAIRTLDEEPSSDMCRALSRLREETRGCAYEMSRVELLRAAYDGPFGVNRPNLDSLFCSELVALAYQRMGFLGSEHSPNEFTPKDFSDAGGIELLQGRLSEERLVKQESLYALPEGLRPEGRSKGSE